MRPFENTCRPEDENQDAAHERPDHDATELMVSRIKAFLTRIPAQDLAGLTAYNGLCTDPGAADRERALNSISRGLADAIQGGPQ